MKLDRIHQISEIVAGIAIVASLIFVGFQLRQNTYAMEQELRQSAMDTWNDIGLAMATSETLSSQLEQAAFPVYRAPDNDHLPPDDVQVRMWIAAQLNTVEDQYLQYLDGNLSEEVWIGYEVGMHDLFRVYRAHNDYWRFGRKYHSPRFQSFVDDLIAVETKRRQRDIAAAAAREDE